MSQHLSRSYVLGAGVSVHFSGSRSFAHKLDHINLIFLHANEHEDTRTLYMVVTSMNGSTRAENAEPGWQSRTPFHFPSFEVNGGEDPIPTSFNNPSLGPIIENIWLWLWLCPWEMILPTSNHDIYK